MLASTRSRLDSKAFSTVLSWNLFGKINVIWMFGRKDPRTCTVIYTLIALVFIFLGTMMSNG